MLFTLVILSLTILSCQNRNPVNPTQICTADASYRLAGDVRDSIYYYSRELYLWDNVLPCFSDLQPRTLVSPETVITKVRSYSPRNSQGINLDKWSFVLPKTEWDAISAGDESDFGCGFRFNADTDLRISYVYNQSSAGQQGVKRGWKVVSINGIVPTRQNIDTFSPELDKSSATIVFQKPDGSQQTLTLNATTYKANFILLSKVITTSNRKVGYLVFNSFLGDNTPQELETVIQSFKTTGINDLVVDLRYNGGGRVDYQELLANLLAPPAAKGQVMSTQQWNTRYQSLNKQVKFDQKPSVLNLPRIVFLTTHSTASASELLINNLKPYMEVRTIGAASAGKPVGFPVIPIHISKTNPASNYVVAPVAFKSVNARNVGDYFNGLPLDATAPDDVTRDFGDPQETSLNVALNYLQTGVLRSVRVGFEIDPALQQANDKLPQTFQGAADVQKKGL